jgi:hypothetical protein
MSYGIGPHDPGCNCERCESRRAPLHPNLPPVPLRMQKLPVDARGFPVPWFVQWFYADGTPCETLAAPTAPGAYPDFRVVAAPKRVLAIKRKLCWVCGEPLGRYMAFVIGPMCAINRISSEPPSHVDCATFSARGCPFLTKPKVVRREDGLPEQMQGAPGVAIMRNPGVALVWITRSYKVVPGQTASGAGGKGFLVEVGDPEEVFWYCEGRTATRAEVLNSIEGGLPLLMEAAALDGPEGVRSCQRALADIGPLLPQEAA